MLEERLKEIFAQLQADAVFIERDFLRRYITGFASTDGFVLIDEHSCRLIVDLRYLEAAQKALSGSGVEVVEGSLSKAMELAAAYRTLAVPFPFLDLARAEQLRAAGHTLLDCMPVLQQAMAVKTEQELGCIRRACEIAEEGFLQLLPQLKEGMTEREAAALLEYHMRALGSEGTSFDTIVAFGANGSVPHHETGEDKLKFGDPILIDFGCKWGGYCSDITRTFLFGDDGRHEQFKRAYEEVYRAHELVKERLHAGMTGREADAIARDSLAAAGLAEAFTHSLGHGIGLQIHEFPYLSPRGDTPLCNGMVFSDEPGVYFPGEFGIRIEDSVCLKEGRVHSFMSKTQRKLVIL